MVHILVYYIHNILAKKNILSIFKVYKYKDETFYFAKFDVLMLELILFISWQKPWSNLDEYRNSVHFIGEKLI